MIEMIMVLEDLIYSLIHTLNQLNILLLQLSLLYDLFHSKKIVPMIRRACDGKLIRFYDCLSEAKDYNNFTLNSI